MSQKKIVHITTVHSPEDARIFHRECKTLSQHYNVTLIAQGTHDYVLDNVSIKAIGKVKNRLLRVTVLQIRALKKALLEKGAIYHIHDPELIFVGLILRIFNKTVIYDAHEDLPSTIKHKTYVSQFSEKLLFWSAKALNQLVALFFSKIVVTTPTIAKTFPAKKTEIIKNYPPHHQFPELTEDEYLKRKNVCSYIGRISKDRGLHQILEVVSQILKSDNINLHLAGSFDPKSLYDDLTQHAIWNHVHYHGICAWDSIPLIMQESRIGLVVLHSNYQENYPLKLFEYMAAGIPVIASDFALWRDFVSDNNCGVLVNPFDLTAISNAILYLLKNPKIAFAMGRNGRKAIEEKYNWESQGTKLCNLYAELLLEHPPSCPSPTRGEGTS